MLGVPLEMVHRWWRILLIYLSGVLAGSLAVSVVDPAVYLAGASGGVYALIAAHLANVVFNWREMEYPGLRLIGFIIIAGVDTGVAVYYRYTGQVCAYLHISTYLYLPTLISTYLLLSTPDGASELLGAHRGRGDGAAAWHGPSPQPQRQHLGARHLVVLAPTLPG